MTYKIYGALIASLSAALILATSEASARTAAGARNAVARPIARPLAVHSLRHHRGRNLFWPGVDGTYYGPDGRAVTEGYPPAPGSNDVRYTYTYDVPWDWAHRFPPNVAPSDRPYVSSCPEETVTVPRRNGEDQTISIMRCY